MLRAQLNDRVSKNTNEEINQLIKHKIENSISFYTSHPELIETRLQELEREWDIERVLEANAGSLMIVGSLLTKYAHRNFVVIPFLVGGFLLQHAIQGWCPPVPLFRKLGVRTMKEIIYEKYSLLQVKNNTLNRF